MTCCGVRVTRNGVKTGYEVRVAGCKIRVAGCWILLAGLWLRATCYCLLVTGHLLLVTCYCLLVTGHLLQDAGCEEKDAVRGAGRKVRVTLSKMPEKSDGLRVMCSALSLLVDVKLQS